MADTPAGVAVETARTAGRFVSIGDAPSLAPQPELKKRKVNAPTRAWRELLITLQASSKINSFVILDVFLYETPL
jgi:hypothetical protein